MRNLSPKAATGQLQPVANPWVQSSGRLLYFGSCRKANSHYSAEAVIQRLARLRPQWIGYRSLGGNLTERQFSELLTGSNRHTPAGQIMDAGDRSSAGADLADRGGSA